MELKQIQETPIYGNFHQDSLLFKMADLFLLEQHPIDEKIEALKIINKAMGIDDPVDQQAVQLAIAEFKNAYGNITAEEFRSEVFGHKIVMAKDEFGPPHLKKES